VVEKQLSRVPFFFARPHVFNILDGFSGRVDRPPRIVCDPNMVGAGESQFAHASSILKRAGA